MSSNSVKIQEELERRILHGLACEWRVALWVLPREYEHSMRMPLFHIHDLKHQFGSWSGEKQEICLSRNLVLNHDWGTVREVLLHEMAHQFADQVLGQDPDEPPHGTTFQQACHLLRANPKASEDLTSDSCSFSQPSPNPELKIVRQIKKLMALAESQNPNEAEAAMAKSHSLIAKYNIDLISHSEDRNFICALVGTPALRHSRDVHLLANLLLDFYFVKGIWVPAYVLDKGKMGRVLEISGTAHNVEIASYVHDFVREYCEQQWQKYNRDKGLNHYRKIDFIAGIIDGFREKLTSRYAKGKRGKEQLALIKINDPLLKEYFAYRYPHRTSSNLTASRQDEGVRKDGVRVGRKMVISKGITEKSGFKNRLLE